MQHAYYESTLQVQQAANAVGLNLWETYWSQALKKRKKQLALLSSPPPSSYCLSVGRGWGGEMLCYAHAFEVHQLVHKYEKGRLVFAGRCLDRF